MQAIVGALMPGTTPSVCGSPPSVFHFRQVSALYLSALGQVRCFEIPSPFPSRRLIFLAVAPPMGEASIFSRMVVGRRSLSPQ